MTQHWLRSIFLLMLAGLVLAGCATTSTTDETPTQVPDDPPPVVKPPQPPTPPKPFVRTGPDLEYEGNMVSRAFFFDYDRAVIKPADLAALELHAEYLTENRGANVVLEGHCDERGTREYNLALGENRSNAVRTFLTSAGVSPRQIETVSYGEERPDDPGHSEAAWGRNRRAVMIYR